MEYFEIKGGRPLNGIVKISGAKNATFPILSAALLIDGKTRIKKVPEVLDVINFINILKGLGVKIEENKDEITIDTTGNIKSKIDHKKNHNLRGTQTLLGALMGRNKEAMLPSLGGCNIGARPIDLHLKGLKELGATVSWKGGYLHAKAKKLKGSSIYLDFPSVGATENLIIAATKAEGTTILENTAREPEIENLIDFLNKAGANIQTKRPGVIYIKGVKKLHPVDFTLIPDRVEAATYLILGAITRGDITIKDVRTQDFEPVIMKLKEMGAEIKTNDNEVHLFADGRFKSVNIKTLPFPGFPTDAQPQIMSLMSVSKGTSIITETIFENRFRTAEGLQKMGASIRIEHDTAIVSGVERLNSANIAATDLRGGAALITAALATKGTSKILDIFHVDRGYEKIEEKIKKLGGHIERKNDNI